MSVRDLFAEERPQIFRGEFDLGQTALILTEGDVMSGSFVLDRTCVSGNTLEIGSCVASEITMTLFNSDGALDDFTFEGSELTASVGVYDDNDTAQMIQLGKFIVDGVPKVRDTVTITALDRMVKFDVPINGLETWWGATKSVTQIVNRCCSVCGVALATNIASFPNSGYTFAKPDELADGMTYRQLLSYAVGTMGKVAWINNEGNLEIGFFGTTTQLELTTENRYSSDYEDYTITITGVVCTKTEENQNGESYDHEYVVGTDDYAFDLSNNPIVASDPATTLAALSGLIGLSYVPFTAATTPCPWIFPMDKVTYEKADGTVLNSVVTNYTFLMNGNNGVQSVGESPTEKARASVGNVASQIKQVIDYAKELAEETLASASDNATALITSATGGQVYFKKVNGVIQEIDIMDDDCYADFTSDTPTYTVGKCWRWNKNGFGFSDTGYNGTYNLAMTMNGEIVADFITTGSLSADRISGGVITSSTINVETDAVSTPVLSVHFTLANHTYEIKVNPVGVRVEYDGVLRTAITNDGIDMYDDTGTQTLTIMNANGEIIAQGITADELRTNNVKLGTVYTGAWTATSTSSALASVTNPILLSSGTWIVYAQTPPQSRSMIFTFRLSDTTKGTMETQNYFETPSGGAGQGMIFVEVTSPVDIRLRTGSSSSCTYSDIGRGWIKAVKVG